jgi:hypothetical protein
MVGVVELDWPAPATLGVPVGARALYDAELD